MPNLSGVTNFVNLDDGTGQSDPTSREIEDHVLTGHASFRSWCAACVQGRGRAERHQGESRKELEDGSKVRRIVGLLLLWSQNPCQRSGGGTAWRQSGSGCTMESPSQPLLI